MTYNAGRDQRIAIAMFCHCSVLISLGAGAISTALMSRGVSEGTGALVVATVASWLYVPCLGVACFARRAELVRIIAIMASGAAKLMLWGTIVKVIVLQIQPVAQVDRNLLKSYFSLVLADMLVGGFCVGVLWAHSSTDRSSGVALEFADCKEDQKFIPMKNSAQTLTPDMEWRGVHIIKPSEESYPSVIKHDLDQSDSINHLGLNHYKDKGGRLSAITDISRHMYNIVVHNENPEVQELAKEGLKRELDAVDRMDNAFLPPYLRRKSLVRKLQPTLDSPSIKNEVDSVQDSSSVHAASDFNPDLLLENDLLAIPSIPKFNESDDDTNISNELIKTNMELVTDVKLPSWDLEKDKWYKVLNNKTSTSTELPTNLELVPEVSNHEAFKEDYSESPTKSFSFPATKQTNNSQLAFNVKSEESDAISELDEYLHQPEDGANDLDKSIIEGLNLNPSSSFVLDNSVVVKLSHTNSKHSPTKSIASIISGNGVTSRHKTNYSGTWNGGINYPVYHSRNNSQIAQASYRNNISSTHSSPKRNQTFKILSKKLSLSNISDTFHSPNGSEWGHLSDYYGSPRGHAKNQSIDFSYLKSLQSTNHSPSRTSPIKGSQAQAVGDLSRRHSVAVEGSSPTRLWSQSQSTMKLNLGSPKFASSDAGIHYPAFRDTPKSKSSSPTKHNLQLISQTISHSDSASDSLEDCPQTAISEYDREKLNVLENQGPLHN